MEAELLRRKRKVDALEAELAEEKYVAQQLLAAYRKAILERNAFRREYTIVTTALANREALKPRAPIILRWPDG